MERSILLATLALGSVGWLLTVILDRGREAPEGRIAPAYPLAAVAVLGVAAIVTLAPRPLWAAGQAWGRGFALGGAAALLAGWFLLRARRGPLENTALLAGPCFAVLGAATGALLWMPTATVDAVVGVATGSYVVLLVFYLGGLRSSEPQPGDREVPDAASAALTCAIGFSVALSATIALGHYRDAAAGSQAARWVTGALALGAGVPVLLLLSGWLAYPAGRARARGASGAARLAQFLLPALLQLGLAGLLSARVLGDARLLHAAAVGLAVPFALWWLAADAPRAARDRARIPGLQGHDALSILLALGAVVAAFYILTGYGIGIALLAGWLPVSAIVFAAVDGGRGAEANLHGEEADPQEWRAAAGRLPQLLLFGMILLLYRLFTQRFEGDLSGAMLTDHFAIFSVLLGALIPPLLAGCMVKPVDAGAAPPGRRLIRLALTLVLAVALPAALLALWGARAALGLLTGLALSTVLPGGSHLQALVPLAVALPLVQWAHPLLLVAAQTRAEKVRVLAWLAGIAVAALVLSDYGERLVEWLQRRKGRPAAPGVQEGGSVEP